MADQTGYSMYFNGRWKSIAQGDNGEILTLVGGLPAWTAPGGAAHNLLSATHTDTTVGTATTGDLIGESGGKWARLAVGTESDLLQVTGGVPAWGTLAAGQIPSLATSKITTGTFDNARIAESNVTQHESALTIGNGQVTGLGTLATNNQVAHQNDSTATDVAGIVSDFNALLAAMAASGAMQ